MLQLPESKKANSAPATKVTSGRTKIVSTSQALSKPAKISRKTRKALTHLELHPVCGPDSKLISTYNAFLTAWSEYLIDSETNREADITPADAIACKIVEMPAYTPEGMLLKINAAASVVGETKTEFPWGGKDFQWKTTECSATRQIEYTLISRLRDDIRRLRPAAAEAERTATGAVFARQPNEDTTLDRIYRHRFIGEQMIALSEAEDQIARAAKHIHGAQPVPLIRWREYSHIGGAEIERARDEFLADGIPAEVIEKEYQDAKLRYEEIKSECRRWEKAVGIYMINQQIETIVKERREILQSFVDKPPVTKKAASELISYILDVYDGIEFDELACGCLASVAKSLSRDEDRR
jgi:hypothetical protein